MTLSKANAAGNAFGWTAISGGAGLLLVDTLTFLDAHSKGIGSICIVIGLFIQWYFKNKAHKEIERHNREMEKRK